MSAAFEYQLGQDSAPMSQAQTVCAGALMSSSLETWTCVLVGR